MKRSSWSIAGGLIAVIVSLSACDSNWGNASINDRGISSPPVSGVPAIEETVLPDVEEEVQDSESTEQPSGATVWPDFFST